MFDTEHNIIPDWPAPDYVQAFVTTRTSFQSPTAHNDSLTGYGSFNLALHVNDNTEKVLSHRQQLAHHLDIPPSNISWLNQVHGTNILSTDAVKTDTVKIDLVSADASTSSAKNKPCAIMTADCLPVLFCTVTNHLEAPKVAAAHAGWRGLANGILSKTLDEFSRPENVIAWLGPAISQEYFEVGQEVYDVFVDKNPKNKQAFVTSQNTCTNEPKWLASLTQLAKIELRQQGIKAIYGGEYCTYKHADLFYSYRRDGAQSGRMASLIMLTK